MDKFNNIFQEGCKFIEAATVAGQHSRLVVSQRWETLHAKYRIPGISETALEPSNAALQRDPPQQRGTCAKKHKSESCLKH